MIKMRDLIALVTLDDCANIMRNFGVEIKTPKSAFKLRDEKTPSAYMHYNGAKVQITDFGAPIFSGRNSGDIGDFLRLQGLDNKEIYKYILNYLGNGENLPVKRENQIIAKDEFYPLTAADELVKFDEGFVRNLLDEGYFNPFKSDRLPKIRNYMEKIHFRRLNRDEVIFSFNVMLHEFKSFLNSHLGANFIDYAAANLSANFKEATKKYLAFFDCKIHLKFIDENNHLRLLKYRDENKNKWCVSTFIRGYGKIIKNIPHDTKFIAHNCVNSSAPIFVSFHAIDAFLMHVLGFNYIVLQSSSSANKARFDEIMENVENEKFVFLIDYDTAVIDENSDLKAAKRLKSDKKRNSYILMRDKFGRKFDLRDRILTRSNYGNKKY